MDSYNFDFYRANRCATLLASVLVNISHSAWEWVREGYHAGHPSVAQLTDCSIQDNEATGGSAPDLYLANSR